MLPRLMPLIKWFKKLMFGTPQIIFLSKIAYEMGRWLGEPRQAVAPPHKKQMECRRIGGKEGLRNSPPSLAFEQSAMKYISVDYTFTYLPSLITATVGSLVTAPSVLQVAPVPVRPSKVIEVNCSIILSHRSSADISGAAPAFSRACL